MMARPHAVDEAASRRDRFGIRPRDLRDPSVHARDGRPILRSGGTALKTQTESAPKPSAAPTSSARVTFAFWARDRAHQDRLAKRIAGLRRTGHA